MSKALDPALELIDDLTDEEVSILADLVGGLNRLEIEDGEPKYTGPEMDLIGRFQDLPDEDDEHDEDDGDEQLTLDEDGEPPTEAIGPNAEAGDLAAEQNFQAKSFAPES